MDITGIIIAGNEQDIISKAILSLSWCKHIILVSANSTDDTIKIAKKANIKIKVIQTYDSYGKNFHKWRNLGLKEVTTSNLFYLDADETVTNELIYEIEKFCNQDQYAYAAIPRQNLYLGTKVYHGGAYPDYQKRLFKTKALRKWVSKIHEQPVVSGKMQHFKSVIIHNTHRNLYDMTEKTLIWTDIIANNLVESKHPPMKFWRLFRMFLTKFTERFIIKSMWRDGTVGLISSIHESYDTVIIYSKLWEIQKLQKK